MVGGFFKYLQATCRMFFHVFSTFFCYTFPVGPRIQYRSEDPSRSRAVKREGPAAAAPAAAAAPGAASSSVAQESPPKRAKLLMQLVAAADDELFSNLSPEELKLVTWIKTSERHVERAVERLKIGKIYSFGLGAKRVCRDGPAAVLRMPSQPML